MGLACDNLVEYLWGIRVMDIGYANPGVIILEESVLVQETQGIHASDK